MTPTTRVVQLPRCRSTPSNSGRTTAKRRHRMFSQPSKGIGTRRTVGIESVSFAVEASFGMFPGTCAHLLPS
ncbi:unnamed protein product [Symbiodinium microadriaticum]|nr:unnamed protein product [Symbiodinium microadriaticum]